MHGKKCVIAMVIVCGMLLGVVAPQAAPVVINGRGQSDADTGEGVVFGDDGSVFVCGRLQTDQNNAALVVIKYSPAGEEQWRDVVVGNAPNGLLGTMAVVMRKDSVGNVFMGGSVLNTGSGADIFVRKYDGHSADKQVWWTRIVDGGANRDDAVKDLQVTANNDVVIGGYRTAVSDSLDMFFAKFTGETGADVWPSPLILSGTATGFRFDTVNGLAELPDGDIAFVGTLANRGTDNDVTFERISSATGALVWIRNLNNPAVNGQDIGYGIAVAGNGDLIVGGVTQNGVTGGDASVFRFTAAGSFVWQQIITKGFSDSIRAVKWRRGVVIAAGSLSESNAADFFVVGLDEQDGHQLWDYRSPGSENSFLSASAMALAPDGVVVTGVSEEGDALSTFQVVKLDLTGTVVWNLPITGVAPLYSEGHAAAVNPDTGAVVATGFTQNTSLDLTVVSITPDGTEAWRRVESGVGRRIDRIDAALALAADPRGTCAVMAGYTQNTGVGLLGLVQDFTLVKVCDGKLRWRRVLQDTQPHLGNAALTVTVDAGGNIFVAGRIGTRSVESQAVAVKYNRRGRKLWETVLPGLDAIHRDEAHAVAVDGHGDVFVAARVSNRFAIFKLDGQNGAVVWPTSVAELPAGTGNALAVTPSGTVVAVGSISGNFAAVECDAATGAEMASRVLLSGGGEARAVALDPEGNPVAAGSVSAPGFGNSFLAVTKFAAGVIVWSQYLTGTSGVGTNTASSVVISAAGGVFVGGVLTNTGTNADAAVVAFAAEGGEQWRQSLDGTAHFNDAINALALADGAVVAGGFLSNTANPPTGIAVVFDGESGMQMHRQDVAGTGNFGQNAVVAVVTRGATAVVAGVMTNADTAQDMFMDTFDVLADRPLVAGR